MLLVATLCIVGRPVDALPKKAAAISPAAAAPAAPIQDDIAATIEEAAEAAVSSSARLAIAADASAPTVNSDEVSPLDTSAYAEQLKADWATIRSAITTIRKASSMGAIDPDTALAALTAISDQVSKLNENAASLAEADEVVSDANVLKQVKAGLGWIDGVSKKTAKELSKVAPNAVAPAAETGGNNFLGLGNPLDILKKGIDAVKNIGKAITNVAAKPEVKKAANGVANVAEKVASISDVIGNVLGVVGLIPGTQAVTVPAIGIVTAVGEIAKVVDQIAQGVSSASEAAAESQAEETASSPAQEEAAATAQAPVQEEEVASPAQEDVVATAEQVANVTEVEEVPTATSDAITSTITVQPKKKAGKRSKKNKMVSTAA
ncbi:hypothetical protein HDU67_006737 [Dinochytrium kinnereticum]|nr:hypothetical protein HDU67_006737 [Dinochytrium kinnereticum]